MPSETVSAGGPLTLICGEDDFSVKQRARQLHAEWCTQVGGVDHEIVDGSAGSVAEALKSLGRVKEALLTIPFFGGGKVVWWQNVSFIGDDRTSASTSVIDAMSEFGQFLKGFKWGSIRLLISAGKPDLRRSFYKTISKVGAVELFEAVSVNDKDWALMMETQAVRTLSDAGKEISDEALGELVNRTGPQPRQMATELDKLVTYVGERRAITEADVDLLVTRQKHARAFALAEALGDRNLSMLMQRLDEELWEIRQDKKRSGLALVGGLIPKIRTMLFLKELKRLGQIKPARDYQGFKSQLERISLSDLPDDKKLNPLAGHPFTLFSAMKQVDRYEISELVRALEILLECNRKLVTSDLDDGLVLQQALIEIVGPPKADRKPA